ncbi:MAG: serine/threonine protein kinase [Acidobacteriota bacterium]|nr:serine/threonine protein kinase [Acidobacteriota bacterium]
MADVTYEAAPELPGLTFVKGLGRGGFADVYLYEQARPRMRVAVKALRSDGLSDAVRERFAAEANAMAELADHPFIVQVFRSDVTDGGRPYMVMKYYPQRNLAVRARAERIPVPDVLQIGVRIASAVETAHRAGILHRDIKPANILTSQYGEPGLTDFGIATTVGQEGPEEADGMSIPWSPPEILFGRSQGDHLADVYSLGATLWHLLAGRSPFEQPDGDNTTVALLRRIKEQAPPRTGRDDVPPSLERVLANAMAKDPAERPPSALELARSLQAVERELLLAATPLVILDYAEAPPEAEVESDENPATQRKRPQRVSAQAPADDPATRARGMQQVAAQAGEGSERTRQRVVQPGPSGRARPRQGMPAEVEAVGTVRRAVQVSGSAAAEPVPSSSGGRSWRLVAAAAAVVAAVVGVGLVLANGSKSGSSTSTSTIVGPAPTAPTPIGDTPVVTATRVDSGHVAYSWTDPSSQPGDTFVVSVSSGPYQSQGASKSLVLAVPAGNQECVSVEIVRSGAAGPPGSNC